MKTKFSIKAIAYLGITAAAVAGLSGSQELVPLNQSAMEAHADGHMHGHEGLTWPPQPRGITNSVIHSNLAQENIDRGKHKIRMDDLERIVKADAGAKRSLGVKHTRITLIDKVDKHNGKVVNHLVYFNRDRNETVEIEFQNKKIQKVSTKPASEYQPEITDEEITEAAELARAHFLNQGHAKVAGLKAFGILAYTPEGVGFDSRVLYISFHEHDDAPPQLMAWVDLTNQLIIKAREE